jgi:hypothetical protein
MRAGDFVGAVSQGVAVADGARLSGLRPFILLGPGEGAPVCVLHDKARRFQLCYRGLLNHAIAELHH